MGLNAMDTREFCLKHGINFIERGDDSFYIEASSARDFVECCRKNDCLILGIEGLRVTETETKPISSLVADFSEVKSSSRSCDEALAFLSFDEAQRASHFDFTITSNDLLP